MISLELFSGTEQKHFGDYAFQPVLRKAAQRVFGDPVAGMRIELIMGGSSDAAAYPGPPEVLNLDAAEGNCTLRAHCAGQPVRERSLRVVDLLGPVLAEELGASHPDVTSWAFRLRRRRRTLIVFSGSGTESETRPEPVAQGSVEVDPRVHRHQPFTLTPLSRDEETVEARDLGLEPERLGRVNILMTAQIHDAFLRTMQLSQRIEEGGFLLGTARRAGDDVHLVQITHVTPAQRSGAGAVHFTFTGESFLAVAQLIEERGQSEKLVGWYHTHLFNVELGMGLSSVDVDLHMATFRRPWQVAALINFTDRGRILRCYGRDGDKLREYEQWISDDSGGYGPARAALGGD